MRVGQRSYATKPTQPHTVSDHTDAGECCRSHLLRRASGQGLGAPKDALPAPMPCIRPIPDIYWSESSAPMPGIWPIASAIIEAISSRIAGSFIIFDIDVII